MLKTEKDARRALSAVRISFVVTMEDAKSHALKNQTGAQIVSSAVRVWSVFKENVCSLPLKRQIQRSGKPCSRTLVKGLTDLLQFGPPYSNQSDFIHTHRQTLIARR